ncbi:DUF305 domain-containing protein [Agromyces sp. G08B096]|uniref:DUF305 domain-containing protein n=1 Tax=Agromyces sp. G08B096 TaxID=3156399 RepID=A0AAU7WBM7_9MICO
MNRSTTARPARLGSLVLATGLALGFGMGAAGCTVAADGRGPAASDRAGAVDPSTSAADAEWVAGMAEHHDQAVALAGLAVDRAADAEVIAAAARIAEAQAAEASALRGWLERRGAAGPDAHADGAMPGEISAEAMDRARDAEGAEFDRLFVDLMVSHHEGAVVMCEERLEASGDAAVTRWARTIASAQAIEIDRLRELAARLDAAGAPAG